MEKKIKRQKTCSGCKKTKHIKSFIKRNKYSDARVSRCKLCQKKYKKLYRERLFNQVGSNRWINKISFEDREKIKELMRGGESVLNLAKKFNVDRKTIYYHTKKIYQKKEIQKEKKEFIKSPFKELPNKFFKPPKGKTYKDYLLEENRKKKQNNCPHDFWTKRCYICKKIIENERNKVEMRTRCKHESWIKRCSSCDKRI